MPLHELPNERTYELETVVGVETNNKLNFNHLRLSWSKKQATPQTVFNTC